MIAQDNAMDNYAGEFLNQAQRINANTIINRLLTKDRRFLPAATITREVQFPDVSYYQQEVDYSIMSTKTSAIILRAGQGEWPDSQFERNYAEATYTGLKKGVYWFYDGRYSPAEQADLLISLLWNKTLEMEVFIDWER